MHPRLQSKEQINELLEEYPCFDDSFVSLQCGPTLAKGMVDETREVVALARKFNAQVVKPQALAMDRLLHKDPEYLAWDFVKTANDWGFYTLWLPKALGGHGYNMASLSYFMEEIASECLAMANLIGVHYLGVGTLSATYNARLMNKLFGDTAHGEKIGQPRLISLAITEPGAGTDVEEVDLVDKGNVSCHAKRVEGGYLINGSKVFISNGHLSAWHMLVAYADLDRPSQTTLMMAVPTGAKGFTFGKIEKKMGQKACPASELVFDNCFVPDEHIALEFEKEAALSRSVRDTCMQIIHYVVSTSRAAVGAFGSGAARGAYSKALNFASRTRVSGRLLINHEWAQCLLAEMYKNAMLARLSYIETNYANSLCGSFKDLFAPPFFYMNKHLPKTVLSKVAGPILNRPAATAFLRKRSLEGQQDCEMHRTSGWASLSKFAATDFGMKNCHLALELMGQAGLRHENGAEKILRDAKLLQIYEGTNQLNRLNLFQCLIAGTCQDACVFDE